jgi:hypothetical protein
MGKLQLQKDIRKNQGLIISDGTLNPRHLLPTFYDILTNYNIQASQASQLKKDIETCFRNTNNGSELKPTFHNQYHGLVRLVYGNKFIQEALASCYDFFDSIAPANYYFGSSNGDGTCIGFFKYEKED